MLNTIESATSVTELRDSADRVLERVHSTGQPVVITADNGDAVAVLISIDAYQELIEDDEYSPDELIRLADEADAGRTLTIDELERSVLDNLARLKAQNSFTFITV